MTARPGLEPETTISGRQGALGDVPPPSSSQRGVLTHLYDPVSGTSAVDDQNVAGPIGIDALNPTAGISEDDEQPVPIYGLAERRADAWRPRRGCQLAHHHFSTICKSACRRASRQGCDPRGYPGLRAASGPREPAARPGDEVLHRTEPAAHRDSPRGVSPITRLGHRNCRRIRTSTVGSARAALSVEIPRLNERFDAGRVRNCRQSTDHVAYASLVA